MNQTPFTSLTQCTARIDEYFNNYLPNHENEIADVESLADFLGTTREALIALENDKTYGFEIRKAKNRIAKIKKQLAFSGKIPAAVLSFDLKNNHGYRDKTDDGTAAETVVIRGKAKEWSK